MARVGTSFLLVLAVLAALLPGDHAAVLRGGAPLAGPKGGKGGRGKNKAKSGGGGGGGGGKKAAKKAAAANTVSAAAAEDTGEPADSKTIEGPDCGHVKQIIGKWAKATEVGTVAGKAQGAISTAEAAAAEAEAAVTQAKEIGAAFEDADGNIPKGIDLAADGATNAMKAAAKASAKLGGKLTTFKSNVAGGEMSGADVEDEEIVEIKDLTTDVNKAAKEAHEVAVATVKKAEEVKEKLLKDSGTLSTIAKKVFAMSSSTVEEATEVSQKSGYAVDDAALLITKAEKALAGLTPMLKDQGDQEPVFQAFMDDLEAKKDGLKDQSDEVEKAIKELDTANDDLKKKSADVKAIQQTVSGGAPAPDGASADLTSAEEALDAVEQALVNTKGKVKTLMERMDKLKAKVEEAEKKLPPPKS